MEIRHLRAFVALAQDLHFTHAAARLHMTQQALSKQISQLETELGTELLHRTTRNVEITASGQTLFEHAVPILKAIDRAVAATRRAALGDTGFLRVAYTPTLGLDTLPPIVERVHERLPKVKLNTVVSWAEQAILGLTHAHFDFAFLRAPIVPDGIEAVTVRHDRLGVILGEASALADRDVVPADALADHALVTFPREHSPGYFDCVVEAFPLHHESGNVIQFENLSPDGFVEDPATRAEIVAGRAFQLTFEGHYDPPPDGFVWRPVDPPPTIRVDLLMRAGPLSATHRRFVEVAREVSAERDWMARVQELEDAPG